MPIHHTIWRVGTQPQSVREGILPSEALLEEMIVAAPEILHREWMIIGRQEDTGYGGRIDLLALAPDGTLILIELKKGKTPREVVAQAIDYAAWAERLDAQDLSRIFGRFSRGKSLDEAFTARFDQPLDPETLNQSHQIVIVAATLDAASERIVGYLNKRDIPINVLAFQVFETDGGQLLSRAWLLDPIETQAAASTSGGASAKEPWNGEYYACFGDDGKERDWEEARRYGFICAGGGAWYSGTLGLLKSGDLVWVKAPGIGFVGVGRVRGGVTPISDFKLIDEAGNERPATEVLSNGTYHREYIGDEREENFVPIEWAETRALSQAANEAGMFGNQNTVCAPKTPKWRHTVERLKEIFTDWDKVPN